MRSLLAGALLAITAGTLFAQTPPDGMALIPAGDFWMGRIHFFLVDAVGWFERDRQDDFPAHRVSIDDFFIDKTEVTNEDYAKFIAAKKIKAPWHWVKGQVPKGEEKFPVYNVDWNNAHDYCAFVGKRLPTEAEWEKAARGGLDRKRYAWGDTLEGDTGEFVPAGTRVKVRAPANFGTKGPLTVGLFPPNKYGVYDMIGNVWEWVNDWYERNYYSISPRRNPQGPETGKYKVIRGAGWIDVDERNLMPSFRNYTDPGEQALTIGFRCAKSAN